MRSRAYSTLPQPNRLKAQPPDIEGRPQKSTPSQTDMRGKFPSIRRPHLEARRLHQSRNTLSTIGTRETDDMTSTNTANESKEAPRSEATTHTVVGATTVMRIGGLLSHRGLCWYF